MRMLTIALLVKRSLGQIILDTIYPSVPFLALYLEVCERQRSHHVSMSTPAPAPATLYVGETPA